MEAVFPITQRNGEPYHTLSDFTKMFDQAKSGRYLLGQGYGWHSGVHLTSKMVPWGKGLRPIQSMLDGKIIAYRIHEDYQKTLYKGQELKFSNNFVLIEHECQNPDDSNDVFKFYSLYMHLAPPADIGANSSPSTRYKMVMEQGKRNVRTFKLDSEPKQESKLDKVGMSKGTILEYLYAEEKETHKYNINGTDYHMIKCRVVEAGDQNSTREKGMEGKLVWFAAGKDSEFDILENTSVMQPVPVSEPPWMKEEAAKLRNGSVVPLTLSVEGTPDLGISINAGDEIGYMGLHEYSNDINATKKEDNRVHIELFSVDEPPEYFKKLISPPNADETPLIVIDGSESDGALSIDNLFFKELAEKVSEKGLLDMTEYRLQDIKAHLETKRLEFTRVIVKHPSEWSSKNNLSIYERIRSIARDVFESTMSRGFVSRDDFEKSPWRKLVLEEYDSFSVHENNRAKECSWLSEIEEDVLHVKDGLIWHYWPFSVSRAEKDIIKLGDKGDVVEEINIRLSGFGGLFPSREFTKQTQSAVAYFQEHYMNTNPTGEVDSRTLEAIDDFSNECIIDFSSVYCPCEKCTGFGNGTGKNIYRNGKLNQEKYHNYEYPGVHRSLLFAAKAMQFCLSKSSDGKLFIGSQGNKGVMNFSSVYRCAEHNKIKGRSSTNHMGKALDMHVYELVNGRLVREFGLREKYASYLRRICIDNMKATKWSRNATLKYGYEPGSLANTWVHIDLTGFNGFFNERFFVNLMKSLLGRV